MKNSEKLKAAILSVVYDADMDQDTKFEVMKYLYDQHSTELIMEEDAVCDTE